MTESGNQMKLLKNKKKGIQNLSHAAFFYIKAQTNKKRHLQQK